VVNLLPIRRRGWIEHARVVFSKETQRLRRRTMAKRPVVTGTEARGSTKEGVVRYVLLASLVLVVVLFIVAYEMFS